MENICRLCLTVQNTEILNKLSEHIKTLEKINMCFSINIIEISALPNQLCKLCINKIEDTYTFYNTVKQNDRLLINYLEKGENELHKYYSNLYNELKIKDEVCKVDNKENDFTISNYNESIMNEIKTENLTNDIDNIINYSSDDEITLSIIKKAKEQNSTARMEFNNKRIPNDNFKCLMCFELFERQVSLLKHYNKMHSEKEDIIRTDLDYIVLSTDGKSVYKCNKCSKEYSSKKSINRHIVGHKENRPFICKICGRTYKTASEIIRHGRVHSGYKLYCRQQCGYSTVYLGALKEHERRHNKSEYKYKCEKCGKGFEVKTWYEQHQNVHNGLKPFVCDLCGVAFHMDRYLTAHRSAVHPQSSKLKRYVCVHCALPCDSMKTLTEHLKVHGIQSSYLCDVCGKTLTNAEQLKFHKRTHLGEKPYKCSTCNKSFAKKFNLQLHQRTHTGERAFLCALCNKRYTQRSTLLRHIARQHAGSEAFKCGKCQEKFTTGTQLASHRKTCF